MRVLLPSSTLPQVMNFKAEAVLGALRWLGSLGMAVVLV
jgi:hypothetical protein